MPLTRFLSRRCADSRGTRSRAPVAPSPAPLHIPGSPAHPHPGASGSVEPALSPQDQPRRPPRAEEPRAGERRKPRPRPEPLFIPPPPACAPGPAGGAAATLFQSQLRSPRVLGDPLLLDPARDREPLPYTPPPMLSPARQGSGLFSSVLLGGHLGGPCAPPALPRTPLTPTPRVLLCRLSEWPGRRGRVGARSACSRCLGEQLQIAAQRRRCGSCPQETSGSEWSQLSI